MSAPAALVVTYGVLVGAGLVAAWLAGGVAWVVERVWWGRPRR